MDGCDSEMKLGKSAPWMNVSEINGFGGTDRMSLRNSAAADWCIGLTFLTYMWTRLGDVS